MEKTQQVEERRKEFRCTQEHLSETIKKKWPRPQDYYLSLPIGDNFQFDITKARLPREEELADYGIPDNATQATVFDQVGHMTIGRINDQVSTLDLKSSDPDLLQFFDELVRIVSKVVTAIPENETVTGAEQAGSGMPKQKGRYRLTQVEIKRRKKIVEKAECLYKEASIPKTTWKEVADSLDISERTLRDWRHNPLY